MRIVSYNVRKAVGLDRRRDPARILRVLRAADADVVLLQEADRRLGRRPAALPPALIRAETDFRVVDHAGSDVSLGWHGNAILVREGVPAEAVDRLALPGHEPRGAVVARCGGLTVVGTHLGLLRRARHAQMRVIRERLDDARGAPALVGGDFNEWSAAAGFEPWAGRLDVLRPGRSFHARRPVARLDGFALSEGLAAAAAGVIAEGEARIASDHLPVRIDLRSRRAAEIRPDADLR